MKKYLRLRTYGKDPSTAYLELIDHPHERGPCVERTVRVHNLIDDYDGPGIAIDFNDEGRAIGIEILYSLDDCDEDDCDEGNQGDNIQDVDILKGK